MQAASGEQRRLGCCKLQLSPTNEKLEKLAFDVTGCLYLGGGFGDEALGRVGVGCNNVDQSSCRLSELAKRANEVAASRLRTHLEASVRRQGSRAGGSAHRQWEQAEGRT